MIHPLLPYALAFVALISWTDAAVGSSPDKDDDVLIIDEEDQGPSNAGSRGVTSFSNNALFRGSYRSLLGVDTGFDGGQEDVLEWRNRLDLSVSMDVSPDIKVRVSGRMKFWFLLEDARAEDDFREDTQRGIFEAGLRDAYALIRLGSGFELTVGNRTFTWGRTDFSQPLDVLNPLDFRDGLVDQGSTSKQPIFAFEATKSLGDVSIGVVWIPFFAPHRIDLFGSDWSLMAADLELLQAGGLTTYLGLLDAIHPTRYEELQGALTSTQDPPQDGLTGSDLAIRVTGETAGIDFGLSYAYQWDRLPVIRNIDLAGLQLGFTGILGTGNKAANLEQIRRSLDLGFERRHVVGGDFEWTIGDFSLKGDVAFSHPRTFYVDVEVPVDDTGETMERGVASIRKPSLAWAFQVDVMPGGGLFISLEYAGSHVFDLDEGTTLLLLKPDTYRLSGTIQWRFGAQDAFHVQLVGMFGLSQGDSLVMPQFKWRLSPAWSVDVGATWVTGSTEEPSPISLFERNDFAYVRANLSF